MNILVPCAFLLATAAIPAQGGPQTDFIPARPGQVEITFLGHGTLMMRYGKIVIHVDPWKQVADYSTLPKADLILVTHHHGDHLDTGAVGMIRTGSTTVVCTGMAHAALPGSVVLANGDLRKIGEIGLESVPAYNLVHARPDGRPFHPKGEGNGYVLTIGGLRIYVAGDTEDTPEMRRLKAIDVAFLPMNLPYTMTPAMVAGAAKAFRPKILYPYHFGETNVEELVRLLEDVPDVEVRIRPMK
jgi:L-ascorbate metabolism protein UlaG (beta-lactamase superfamily)